MPRRRSRPLVYSCSGRSSAAQLADAVAVKLDRDGTDLRTAERVFDAVRDLVRARPGAAGTGIAVPETETAEETPG